MNDDQGKRLLNEILPDPELNRGLDPGSARERTLRHLKKVLAATTTAGMALQMKACVGYGVVDPLPAPAEICSNELEGKWANVYSATAAWADAGGEQLEILVDLNPAGSGVEEIRFSDQVVISGGVITRVQRDGAFLTLGLLPEEEADEIDLTLAIECYNGDQPQMQLHMVLSGPPVEGSQQQIEILN